MRILDRYIVKQFLQNYLILWVVLGGLYVLVDLIVDLDEFLRAGRENAERFGGVFASTTWAMADYYGPMFLLLFTILSSLIVVAAIGFTISQLQRSREVTAILASGVSLYRVAAPVLIAGFLINLLVLPVQEYAIPGLAEQLVRSKSDIGRPTLKDNPIHYARDDAGSLISASKFSVEDRLMADVRIIERDEMGRQTRLIRADEARWSGSEAQGRWMLVNGRAFDTAGDQGGPIALGGESVASYETELSPAVLITRVEALYIRLQSIKELQSMRDNQALSIEQRASVTQVVWSRFSTLVMGVLIMLMALPFFLTRVPGNLLRNSGYASTITLLAWAGGMLLVQIDGLNPITAALLPVVLFVPVAFYLVTTIKT